jgi:hypothetical protein
MNRRVTRSELIHADGINARGIPYWFPVHQIDMGREMMRHGGIKRGQADIASCYYLGK